MTELAAFISTMRFGWEWMTRPIVMIVLGVALLIFVGPLIREWRAFRSSGESWYRKVWPRLDAATAFYAIFLLVLIWMWAETSGWRTEAARTVPTIVLYFAFVAVILGLFHHVLSAERIAGAPDSEAIRVDLNEGFDDLPFPAVAQRALAIASWLALLLAMIWLFGMLPAVFMFIVAYMRVEGREAWWVVFSVSTSMTLACYVLFDQLLRVVWPQTLLGAAIPALKDVIPLL